MRTLKKANIDIKNPIYDLIIDDETREKQIRKNNFLRLIEELIINNQDIVKTMNEEKAS